MDISSENMLTRITARLLKIAKRLDEFIPLTLLPAVLYLVVLYAYPLVRLLGRSVFDPEFTLEHYERFITTPAYPGVLANTFEIAIVVTLICLFLGYPLAYFLSNRPPRISNILFMFILLPFFTSLLVRNYAWMILLGNNGVFNKILLSIGIISERLPLMFNRFGVIVSMTHVLLPWMVLPMYSVMSRIDKNLLRAADNLGAGPFQSFRKIFLPLSMPGVRAGVVLVFIFSIGFYITPTMLGGTRDTMLGQLILMKFQMLHWSFAASSGVILLAFTILALLIVNRFIGIVQIAEAGSFTGQIASKAELVDPQKPQPAKHILDESKQLSLRGFWQRFVESEGIQSFSETIKRLLDALSSLLSSPAEKILQARVFILGAVVVLLLLYLMLPLLVVIPISFSSADYLTFPPPGFSFRWYELFLTDRDWYEPAVRSFQIAIATMIFTTILAIPASIAMARQVFKWKNVIYAFILTPMIIPEVVTGLGVYLFVAGMGLADTQTGLVLGHTIFAIPPAVVVLSAALQNFDWDLERAALSLGANRLQAVRNVTFPLILPAILTAGLFAFLRSFDDLTMAILIGGVNAGTLPRKMWSDVREFINPTVAAVSTILIAFSNRRCRFNNSHCFFNHCYDPP